MEDRFYVRLTNEEQIAVGAERLIEIKAGKRSRGLIVKKMMVADGEWDSFFKDCVKHGEDPETEATGLEEMVKNAR